MTDVSIAIDNLHANNHEYPMTKIELHGVEKRKGPTLSMDIYEKVCAFIISAIKNQPEGSICFSVLLDEAEKNLIDHTTLHPWHIMQVKIDLTERGVIKTSIDARRKQMIAIKTKKKNKPLAIL
jgi:hypothetical protein